MFERLFMFTLTAGILSGVLVPGALAKQRPSTLLASRPSPQLAQRSPGASVARRGNGLVRTTPAGLSGAAMSRRATAINAVVLGGHK